LPYPLLDASSTQADSTFIAIGGYTNYEDKIINRDVLWYDADENQWFKAPQTLKSGQAGHAAIAGNWDYACN